MPVGLVGSREGLVMQHQEILGVVLLSRRGEVERAGVVPELTCPFYRGYLSVSPEFPNSG